LLANKGKNILVCFGSNLKISMSTVYFTKEKWSGSKCLSGE